MKMMTETYCVSCGNTTMNNRPRCTRCFAAYKDNPTHKRAVDRSVGSIKVEGWEIAGRAQAKYCHTCGEEIDEKRRRFAVNRGGEAKYCFTCSYNKS